MSSGLDASSSAIHPQSSTLDLGACDAVTDVSALFVDAGDSAAAAAAAAAGGAGGLFRTDLGAAATSAAAAAAFGAGEPDDERDDDDERDSDDRSSARLRGASSLRVLNLAGTRVADVASLVRSGNASGFLRVTAAIAPAGGDGGHYCVLARPVLLFGNSALT